MENVHTTMSGELYENSIIHMDTCWPITTTVKQLIPHTFRHVHIHVFVIHQWKEHTMLHLVVHMNMQMLG